MAESAESAESAYVDLSGLPRVHGIQSFPVRNAIFEDLGITEDLKFLETSRTKQAHTRLKLCRFCKAMPYRRTQKRVSQFLERAPKVPYN